MAKSWSAANGYCQDLDLGGQSDWRLPTVAELNSIRDLTAAKPSVPAAFAATNPSEYWTAVPQIGQPDHSWALALDYGGFCQDNKMLFGYRARCIRGALPQAEQPAAQPAQRFSATTGTVADALTKLTWQRVAPTTIATLADAAAYCAGLTLEGGGWKLPTLTQLESLVDHQRAQPAMDAVFANEPSNWFWSATPRADALTGGPGNGPTIAWGINFASGGSGYTGVTGNISIRCVR